jgi:prolyl-tRNA synthetase
MKQSQLFGTTRKEAPHEEESLNAILLSRGGYIDKTSAGVYSYLPLGLKVLRKVQEIVREEMNKLPHTQELLMPAMQPKEIWEETGRWDDAGMKEVMYRVNDTAMGLGATHEENVVDLFRKFFSSYRDLPTSVYQIQTKFRKEARPKSGLLRGREFMMKDMYSFHTTEEDFKDYYEKAADAYMSVFKRLGLEAVRTEASGGVFSKTRSDEFQVINPVGEDTIYLNATGDRAWNKEVVENEDDPKLIEWGGGEVRKARATEVGNIFTLEDKYTKAMNAGVTLENGERMFPLMGCYGIGISRLMGTIVEVYGDEKGAIRWPEHLAPFKIHVIDLANDDEAASKLFDKLEKEGFNVKQDTLYDDRDKSAGEKFADADLIGAPIRIVLSKRSLAAGGVEVIRNWNTGGEAAIESL